jgi:hypothetical protein
MHGSYLTNLRKILSKSRYTKILSLMSGTNMKNITGGTQKLA